jgi:AcrR family transcriptional regulator
MGGDVKTRSYDTGRRAERTRATKLRVVEAARDLFLERGYPATTMDAISTAAEVPSATLYRLFPSKRDVLKAVVDITAGGDDDPVTVHDRPEVRAINDEHDPRRYLIGWARMVRALYDRITPIERMLRSAAVVDADSADMLATLKKQRFAGQGAIVRGLVARKALRPGITDKQAHDVIYGLMSAELRTVLLEERRWTAKRYEAWLADAMCDLLLPRR